jgi:hypothetical protein
MNQAPEPDDPSVEQALRELLDPLDRHLERGRTLLAGALVLVVPAMFLLLWLVFKYEGKFALGWGIVAFAALLVLGLSWELLIGWLVCRRFNRCFPHGTATRSTALRILAEMETPSKAEEKLRGVLASAAPERIVRHRPSPAATAEAHEKPPLLELPPARPDLTPSPTIHPAPTTNATRPGGYYDYIPLEPRASEDRPPDRSA